MSDKSKARKCLILSDFVITNPASISFIYSTCACAFSIYQPADYFPEVLPENLPHVLYKYKVQIIENFLR